jgi:LysR family transcriptional regulator, salicylic acid-responsive activator of bsdBCD
LLRGQSTFYQQVMNACKQAGFTPRVICEGAETATLLRLVATGVGITIVPEYGLKLMPHLQSSLVGIPIQREPEQESLTTTLGLVWRRGCYRSQTARLVEDIIKEVVQSSILSKEGIS